MLFYDSFFIVCCQHDCLGELFGTALLENKVSLSPFSGMYTRGLGLKKGTSLCGFTNTWFKTFFFLPMLIQNKPMWKIIRRYSAFKSIFQESYSMLFLLNSEKMWEQIERTVKTSDREAISPFFYSIELNHTNLHTQKHWKFHKW